jgi:hypothetical protein
MKLPRIVRQILGAAAGAAIAFALSFAFTTPPGDRQPAVFGEAGATCTHP